MIVADIMTQPIVAIDPLTPLVQAIHLMTEHKISGLPVVEKSGQIVGILTEGDLLRRVETGTAGEPPGWLRAFFQSGRLAADYIHTHGRRVSELMTVDVITVTEDLPLSEAVGLMLRHHVKRLPVVRDDRLLAIVSRADLIRRLGDALSLSSASAGDEVIHKAILDAMENQPWAPSKLVSVLVQNGAVELDGCLVDQRERDALEVLIENVPGVKRVANRIVCVEPYSGVVTYDP